MPDRGSEELRFSEMLRLLALDHEITLYVWSLWGQSVGENDRRRYRAAVEQLGIEIREGYLRRVLKERRYDLVLIEWFHGMDLAGDDIRTWQPGAKIIVDAVDLEYRRLGIKAEVTGHPDDIAKAADTRRRELAAYANADFVITVSDEERKILERENPRLRLGSVPNIHRFPDRLPPLTDEPVMIFVGDYRVPPNVDAVLYFCREILPLIHARAPEARLLVVGNAPTDEIRALASDRIEVTGYVPEVAPHLARSRVSVAPLRYGAGMKGKVGEAMSGGIPVVTTSVGLQGMEVQPDNDLLVADDPEAFAAAVIRLMGDTDLCRRLRESAWSKMKEQFGTDSARRRLKEIMASVSALPAAPGLSVSRRLRRKSLDWLEHHVLWRLKRATV